MVGPQQVDPLVMALRAAQSSGLAPQVPQGTPEQASDSAGYTGPDASAIEYQKTLAKALREKAGKSIDPNRMAGGYVLPISPFEGLAKLGQNYFAGQAEKNALSKEKTYKDATVQALMAASGAKDLPSFMAAVGKGPSDLAASLAPMFAEGAFKRFNSPQEVTLTPAEVASVGLPVGSSAQRDPVTGKITVLDKGDTPSTNIKDYELAKKDPNFGKFLTNNRTAAAQVNIQNPSLQPVLGSDGKMYGYNPKTNTYAEAKGLESGVTATKPTANAASSMTPAAIDDMATTWMMTGTPPVGMGRMPAVLAKIANRKAEMEAANGDTAASASSQQVANRAAQAGLKDITTRSVMLEANANNAERNFKTIEKLSMSVDRTGSPMLNKLTQAFQTHVVQDPNLAALKNAVSEGATEYAKVVTGQTTGQAVTDAANAQMQKLLSVTDNPEAFAKELATMREFIGNRKAGFAQEKQSLLDSMKVQKGQQTPAAAPAGQPKILHFDAQGNPVQ